MNCNRVVSLLSITALLAALLIASSPASAGLLMRPLFQSGASQMVSYQGQVTVDGIAYTGTGYFKFAVVNQAGDVTYWANDGTTSGEPMAGVTLTVTNGLFNVLLGDTSLTDMTALPATAFNGTERYLRVWFSREGATFTLLAPDRRIAAVPYALQAEEAKNADTLDGQHAGAFQQHEANVIIVAKSGGDFTTITAALNSIMEANATNRYLIKIMPGIYSERVTMKQCVDIEGSGELTTKITTTSPDGTLVGANDAELRFLTVENTGGTDAAIAIYNVSASPHLTNVTANASGADTNVGVVNIYSSLVMTHVSANAWGGTRSVGVYNYYSSLPVMIDVIANAAGGANDNYGVYSEATFSPVMMDVIASASGGTNSYGVGNFFSSPAIQNSVIRANDGVNNYGIYNLAGDGSYTVTVNNSQVTGSTNTIYNDPHFITQIGASLLAGGPVENIDTLTCAGVYDENYAFSADTCP